MMLKKLKLNGTTYKVIEVENLLDSNGEERLQGYFEPKKLTISIDKDNPDPYRMLLHELLHAVCMEYNLKSPEEELIVSVMESGVVSLLRNNPQFVKELMKGNK